MNRQLIAVRMVAMSETLTFENYSPLRHGLDGIYQIGAKEQHPLGVGPEMAAAFGYQLNPRANVDNLGGLIGTMAPSKKLQENIAFVRTALEPLGDPVEITRSWAEVSGLLQPVERLYITGEQDNGDIDLAVITGGVRNWMERRAARLVELVRSRRVGGVLLAAGVRKMGQEEGPNVEEGMTEADYMAQVIAPQLGELGIRSELLAVDSTIGDEVMTGAVSGTRDLVDSSARIVVVSNAGAWVQNAGQYLRAAKNTQPEFDHQNDQFEVVSDSFPLGTGAEPIATHQNPLSATGQIIRNLQEFTRHAAV